MGAYFYKGGREEKGRKRKKAGEGEKELRGEEGCPQPDSFRRFWYGYQYHRLGPVAVRKGQGYASSIM